MDMEKIEELLKDEKVEGILCSLKKRADIFKKYWIISKVYQSEIIKDNNILIIRYRLWE